MSWQHVVAAWLLILNVPLSWFVAASPEMYHKFRSRPASEWAVSQTWQGAVMVLLLWWGA